MNYLIIPAYQPDLNLVKLVRLVHAKSDLHIIVVDDGSDADKKAIFDKLDGLATVLTHEHNQGKGQSLKTAYAYILERGTYGSIVTADADGQHKIWDIFRVVNQSQEHPGTLILGARAFSGKVPLRSAFGNKLTRFLFKQQTGVAVSDTVREDASNGDLAIYKDGSFKIIYEDEISANQLVKDGVVNLLAFGPSLVENGEITVDTNSEVGQSMASNPRTAIGIIDENHYIIVVSDGRTSESEGLSLYQLAEVMKSYGVKTAYNLDGGGSSTLYFNGQVINKPTTNGTISERAVSDIVYIGY